MPQFAPGESKTAIAPIVVAPSGLSCEAEIFLGPDEMTKVVTSGRIPFVSTGVSQDVRLPIAMPSAEGTYHVYIDGYAEGYLVAAYQAVEDVVIAPAVGNFVYSDQVCGWDNVIGAPAWLQATYSCRITNQGSKGTRIITFHYQYFNTYVHELWRDYSESFALTLEAGESLNWIRGWWYEGVWYPGTQDLEGLGACSRVTMWLEDSAGGSTTPCVLEIGYY